MAMREGVGMEQPVPSPSGARREVVVTATTAALWALVTDVERFGEWSPETYRVEWRSPPPHEVGSIFRGYNRNLSGTMSWWSDCEVLAQDRERAFSFRVRRVDFGDGNVVDLGDDMSTTWRHHLDPSTGADRAVSVALSFDCPALADNESLYSKAGRFADLESGCEQTLRRLKETAERT